MKFIKYIFDTLKEFCYILSINVIFIAIFFRVYSYSVISSAFIWQLILLCGIATIFNLIYHVQGWVGKLHHSIKVSIHVLLVFALYIASAYHFSWFKPGDMKFILYFSIFLALGYVFCFAMIYIVECKQAKLINSKIEEYKRKKDQDETCFKE